MREVLEPVAGSALTCNRVVGGNPWRACGEPAIVRVRVTGAVDTYTFELCGDHAHAAYPEEYADLCRRMSAD